LRGQPLVIPWKKNYPLKEGGGEIEQCYVVHKSPCRFFAKNGPRYKIQTINQGEKGHSNQGDPQRLGNKKPFESKTRTNREHSLMLKDSSK